MRGLFLCTFLLLIGAPMQIALAVGPNDYNEDMVTLEHNFAACVGSYYKHDLSWQTLPGICCGFRMVNHFLMQRSYPAGTNYSDFAGGYYVNVLRAPQCMLVPHNNWYKMRLEATPPGDVLLTPRWQFWVSHEVAVVPMRCVNSQ